ncbi:MAG TPA: hypothetical protein VFI42_06655 [Thermomicrobiaceae bacterium]|nr:hypothetical protein [Thermomicrobiaceae bacterium]
MDEERSEQANAAREGAVDLGKVRDLILAAHPGVIPELVQGDTIDALIGSVEAAEAAYQRIVEAVKAQQPTASAAPTAPTVSAGQPASPARQFVVNVEELSSESKIAEGLRRLRKQ